MEIKLPVKGMTCGGCETLIKEVVSELDGVKSVKADRSKNEVFVKFDEKKISTEKIKEAVTGAGYEVK